MDATDTKKFITTTINKVSSATTIQILHIKCKYQEWYIYIMGIASILWLITKIITDQWDNLDLVLIVIALAGLCFYPRPQHELIKTVVTREILNKLKETEND